MRCEMRVVRALPFVVPTPGSSLVQGHKVTIIRERVKFVMTSKWHKKQLMFIPTQAQVVVSHGTFGVDPAVMEEAPCPPKHPALQRMNVPWASDAKEL